MEVDIYMSSGLQDKYHKEIEKMIFGDNCPDSTDNSQIYLNDGLPNAMNIDDERLIKFNRLT